MDDELFMADSSPSKHEESSSGTLLCPQFGQLFSSSLGKSKLLSYHMLKSILKRLIYKYSTTHKQKKLKILLR